MDQAEAAIRALVLGYADAVDRGDGDALAALFSADGILETPAGTWRGRTSLQTLPANVQSRYRRTFHAVLNQIVEVSGEAASARTYCIARHLVRAPGADACLEMTIIYHDDCVRENGRWLIARRRMERLWTQTSPVSVGEP